MSNQYLVEIHNYLTNQLEKTKLEREDAQARGDHSRSDYLDGMAAEMLYIRKYLSNQFDLITQKYY